MFAALDRQGAAGRRTRRCRRRIKKSARPRCEHANKEVYTAVAHAGQRPPRHGLHGRVRLRRFANVVVGHVGDSRTYHLHQGRLIQLTRDQTLVNRLVELGQLTAEEAEDHPRKNELQQAIGGQPDVDPGALRTASCSAATGCWSAPTA